MVFSVREEDLVYCNECKTRIGFVNDHIQIVQNGRTGVFEKVFNVQNLDSENHLRQVNCNAVADIYCAQCGMLLGLKLIAVPQPSIYVREGICLMDLDKLVYFNDYPMLIKEKGGPHGAVNIDEYLNEQAGGANIEQVPKEQDEGENIEQVPNEQDEGANIEQVTSEQGGGDNIEQVPNEEDGGANDEQVPNEDVDQVADGMDNIDLNPEI
ncbi:protein yippee-like At3g08990 [Lycium barbarum]|uniref:protein yippee-like At3g08990 n=1 Tax=Lycium barbarum TaxID=112863 RepID=UPI00293F3F9E|nr:protein yippee-like At3g08990 [Lycium barbarum]